MFRRPTPARFVPIPRQNEVNSRRKLSSDEALSVWRAYKRDGDLRLRNRLVMTYAPLVKYIAFRKVRELPAHCDVEDFISCGLEALMASIERYDPDQGRTLEQYVWTRIHGAILDELRRQDWAPRSLRRWERDIAKAREQFLAHHGRAPTREELADSLAVSVDELRAKVDDIAKSDVTSLNSLVASEDGTTVERVDTIASEDSRSDPEAAATLRQAKESFRRAFGQLSRRDREVAVLLYVKHLTLRETGEVLGLSEARICQIHAGLKRELGEKLAAQEALFLAVA